MEGASFPLVEQKKFVSTAIQFQDIIISRFFCLFVGGIFLYFNLAH